MSAFPTLGYLFDEDLRSKAGAVRTTFFTNRLWVLKVLLFLSFSLLLTRLIWLQVFQGEKNRILSDENRILVRSIQAPRGIIRDREGGVFVQNVPIFQK